MNYYQLSAIISLSRHGEKNPDGHLTQQGVIQAVKRGLQLKYLPGNVSRVHSGVDRVANTAKAIAKYLSQDSSSELSDMNPDRILESDAIGVEEVNENLHYLLDPTKKDHYFGSWGAHASAASHNAMVQEFLNLKTNAPDDPAVASPYVMAVRASKVIVSQLEKSLSTSYDVTENFINTTHEPVLMSFLYYVLNDFSPDDPEFVERIGGSIDFAEGLEIMVYQTDNDHLVQLQFRNFLKVLDLLQLTTFSKHSF